MSGTAAAEPRRLTPSVSARPWGGGRFGTVDGVPVGELWVSGDDATLPDGRTLAAAGLAAEVPLVKLLDVAGRLSVQVHPDDPLARELHGPDGVGKHEAWVILEAAPDASLYLGLHPGIDPEAAVADLFSADRGRIERILRTRRVAEGTVIDVPPGTVHAPGSGLLLYEVQQRSDLTYRIWDWGRDRPLHLEAARRAIRPDADPIVGRLPTAAGRTGLSEPHAPFRIDQLRLDGLPLTVDLAGWAVLSIVVGELRLDPATDAPGASRSPSPAAHSAVAGSHWLLAPGHLTITGTGDGLLARY